MGSHSRLLERVIINVQAPDDLNKSLSVVAKIELRYQQNWRLRDSILHFTKFSIIIMITAYFSKVE